MIPTRYNRQNFKKAVDNPTLIKDELAKILGKKASYAIIRKIADLSPASSTFEVHRTANIEQGCNIQGDIIIKRDAAIGSDCIIQGRLCLNEGARLHDGSNVNGQLTVGKELKQVRIR